MLISAAVSNHADKLGQLIDQHPLRGCERHRLCPMPSGFSHAAEKDKELSRDVLSRGRAEVMSARLQHRHAGGRNRKSATTGHAKECTTQKTVNLPPKVTCSNYMLERAGGVPTSHPRGTNYIFQK